MTSAPLDPLIGQTLDERYVIRSRIARGGMAMVYLANDLRLERKVAVKVMHEHLAEDENFTRRFDQEARSAARLSHANLVNVFDQGHDLGRTYLVMEYLPSMTLRELLKQQERLTLNEALEISEAILSGLAAAHSAGIVHRDLKPENVLLVDDGRIKIGDFGLARAVSQNTTTGQALLGTIAYLSPELVTRGQADERSDLYAFGIMLFEMLTGTQPFVGEQPLQIAYQHAHSDVPAPSSQGDFSTPALDDFVVWLTERDPAERPADAGAALEVLHEVRRDPWAPLVLPEQEPGDDPAATSVLPGATAVLPGATTVLPADLAGDQGGFDERPAFRPAGGAAQVTPSTTVLAAAESAGLAAGAALGHAAASAQATPSQRAAAGGAKRARRGRITAAILAGVVLLAAGAGYWFGQGPGSQVTVPDVSGASVAEATEQLTKLQLEVSTQECTSLTVAAGLAGDTQPAAGARLDRGTGITLCVSTGPELLPVPTIVGLSLDDAIAKITESRFEFGKVVVTRFSDANADVVLAALDGDENALGDTLPEQSTVNLVVSAGHLPNVSGKTVDQATKSLRDQKLTVDESLNTEAYSEDVPEGQVIAAVWHTDPVRPGDTVGLQLSLGPELFEIPSVQGLPLQQALDTLSRAGFSPITAVPDLFRDFAEATGTTPAAGTRVKAGTEIRVTSQLSL